MKGCCTSSIVDALEMGEGSIQFIFFFFRERYHISGREEMKYTHLQKKPIKHFLENYGK